MATSFASTEESRPPDTLAITIRFTTSIPDLFIDIPTAADTSVIALKHLIRSKLDKPTSQNRFRLIHSGKLLRDGDVLSAVLRAPTPPPRAPDPKGKGKAVEPPTPRVYINCSIGDALTTEELALEASAAIESVAKSKNSTNDGSNIQVTTTTPAPRGFDRLLSGGFTPAEVNQLRLQFLSIQSSIHTPDTMPSPGTLRQMEDAWIDNNASGTGGSGFDFGDNEFGGSALDDMLWGNILGFLWPLGCLAWAVREEGIWSKRKRIAVCTGFVFSLSFGVLRVIG